MNRIKHRENLDLRYIAVSIFFFVFFEISFLNAAATITVDGLGSGRTFDGLGAWSSGGNSRLLVDYEQPYRDDILDLLFKPKYGASLQHFRVEVGSGTNSGSGTEPSHAISRKELNSPVPRGYELWLLKEANHRNPEINFDCMFFGFPYWFTDQFSQDFADYIVAFLDLAKQQGIELDWIAPTKTEMVRTHDEIIENLSWVKETFLPTMDNNCYHPNILLLDGGWWCWRIFEVFDTYPEYERFVDACGGHNIDQKPSGAPCSYPSDKIIASGKRLWSSGDSSGTGRWKHATEIVERMNRLYLKGKITNMQLWNIVDGCLGGVIWSETGLLKADCPWSGYYKVHPTLWAVAHYTQFTEVGWKYLDDGCGYLSGSGNYVTLKDPDSDHWSTIIYCENDETLDFSLANVLTDKVHVWKTTRTNQFIRQQDITPLNGTFSMNCSADSLYSLTSTSGQKKGLPAKPIPDKSSFPMPFSDDFENYKIGSTPKYISDMQGTFEVAACYGNKNGKCLQQIIPEVNENYMWWSSHQIPVAMTLFGDMSWRNYEFTADVYIEEGKVYLSVRKGKMQLSSGYAFIIDKSGNWKIRYDNLGYGSESIKEINNYYKKFGYDDVIANNVTIEEGNIARFDGNKWHTVKIRCINNTIRVYVDESHICTINHNGRKAGQPCFGSSYNYNQFDNLSVQPTDSLINR